MNDQAINTETRDRFILDTVIREAKKLDAAAPPPLPGNRSITFYHSDPFVVGEAANKIGLNASVFRKTCEAADPDVLLASVQNRLLALDQKDVITSALSGATLAAKTAKKM